MMGYDCHNQVTVMFGGLNASSSGGSVGTFKKDVWHWTGSEWTRKRDFSRTISRSAFAYDTHRHVFVSHGGSIDAAEGTNPAIGETWEYDAATDTWSPKSIGVGPRHPSTPAAIAYDSVRRVMVLVTENVARDANPAVWEYDGATGTWTQKPDAPFASRSRHTMVFDGRRTILYGGKPPPEIGGPDYSDTWAYDGVSWTELTGADGIPRSRHTMVWDSSVNVAIVTYGTSSTAHADDVSILSSAAWQPTVSDPPNRDYHAAAYQNHSRSSVMFGGRPDMDDTWTLTCAISDSAACNDSVCGAGETCSNCAADCGVCPEDPK